MLTTIISGGQTGADQIGLEIAKHRGLQTGGTAPKGYRTENGADINLKLKYGLVEGKTFSYNHRTKANVLDSNGTVLFGDMNSLGSHNTIQLCITYSKPYIPNPTPKELVAFINRYKIVVLNVAGNRGSKMSTNAQLDMRACLNEAFTKLGISQKHVQTL